MPIASKYNGKCKDCGADYTAGDTIDLNGNESLNKNGEMKGHWCKDGKNCKGVMALGGSVVSPVLGNPNQMLTTGNDMPPVSKEDPTPEQYLMLGNSLLSPLLSVESKEEYVAKLIEQTRYKIADVLIKRSVIEGAMNDLGLEHPGRRGFIEDVLR